MVKKIEGLDNNHELLELELYDNKLSKIENIGHLHNLTFLDLAFNVINCLKLGLNILASSDF